MLGTPEQPGVMVQALADLFHRLEGEEGAAVRLAYIEIYNENVRDLLAPDRSRNLELREDPHQARARARRCPLLPSLAQRRRSWSQKAQLGSSERGSGPAGAQLKACSARVFRGWWWPG